MNSKEEPTTGMTKHTKVLTYAVVDAVLAMPNSAFPAPQCYLPTIYDRLDYARGLVLEVIFWAERQGQSIDNLIVADALDSVIQVVPPITTVATLRTWKGLAFHHHVCAALEDQLIKIEQRDNDYQCTTCALVGYKLWRQRRLADTHDWEDPRFLVHYTPSDRAVGDLNADDLFCVDCAEKDQQCKLNLGTTTRIRNLMPAIPQEDPWFWGHHSAPPNALAWWEALTTRPTRGENGET